MMIEMKITVNRPLLIAYILFEKQSQTKTVDSATSKTTALINITKLKMKLQVRWLEK